MPSYNSSVDRKSTKLNGTESYKYNGSVVSTFHDILTALTVALLLGLMLLAWFALDHHVPTTDEAGHILSSLGYENLFLHARPFNILWWHKFLTVSSFYPPSTYILGGLLKMFFHESRLADVLVQTFFCITLSLSTFALSKQLKISRAGAAVSALVIGLFPGNVTLNHTFNLDLPLVSMVAFGLALITWWAKTLSIRSSILCGLGLGFAVLTKQLVASFLAPAALVVLFQIFVQKKHTRMEIVKYCLLLISSALVVILPWLVTNIGATFGLAKYNRECMAGSQNIVQKGFLSNLLFYCLSLVRNSSPLLLLAAAFGFITAKKEDHQAFIAPLAMSIGGILLLSCLNWCDLFDRYTMSTLICLALYTGLGAQKLIGAGRAGIAIVSTFLLLAFVQYLCLYFPLQKNPIVTCARRIYESNPKWAICDTSLPCAKDLWGSEQVLNLIESTSTAPAWLNVMVNQAELNAHTFQLLAAERKCTVRPTTTLVWTLAGDKVDFSPTSACYYQWYLIKTGSTGYKFYNTESEKNYYRLLDYLKDSGKFVRIWSFRTPDNQSLYLYHQL